MTPVPRLLTVFLLGFGMYLAACGPRSDNSHVRLAPPVESTTLGPGDVITVEIVGEKELPTEYQVASDGTIAFPYVQQVKIDGMEPQEVAQELRTRLMEKKILTDPSIVVRPKAYNSKLITLLGQVSKPGSFALAPGMTFVQAISQAGGFTSIANRDRINLTRKTKKEAKTVVISADAITDGRSPDFPLQAGDQIYVHERIF